MSDFVRYLTTTSYKHSRHNLLLIILRWCIFIQGLVLIVNKGFAQGFRDYFYYFLGGIALYCIIATIFSLYYLNTRLKAAFIIITDIILIFLIIKISNGVAVLLQYLLPILEIAEYFRDMKISLAGTVAIGGLILVSTALQEGIASAALLQNLLINIWSVIALIFLSYIFTASILDLQKEVKQIHALLSLVEAGQELGSSLAMPKIINMVVNMVRNIVECNTCVIYLREKQKEGDIIKVAACDSIYERFFKSFSLDVAESVVAEVIKRRGSILLKDAHQYKKEKIIPQLKLIRSVIVAPCLFQGEAIGAIYLAHPIPDFYDDEELKLISILANQAALAIKNAQLHETTAQLAITDSLSGLYTHGYFQDLLGKEFRNAYYNKKPISLIILDIDFFKIVNDNFGHPQGDALLKQVGGIIKSVARENDVVARYGGDEFTVVCLNTNKIEAVLIAERIRQAVEEYEFVSGTKIIKITMSAGVASFPEDCDTKKDLIEIADQALYEAKQTGRNRVCHR